MIFDVIIIGGGPAGLFAATSLSEEKNVLVLEKNAAAGRKLLMAGSGRCNITHDGNISEFLKHYGGNFRFLKTALRAFTNKDMLTFFKERGLETIADKNGKIFPSTENANDVLNVLLKACRDNQVKLNYNEAVVSLEKEGELFKIKTNNSEYQCRNLVIATGGKSYPKSGSSGDGYGFAEILGHSIVEPRPALSPVFVNQWSFAEISGVSLQQRIIYLYRNNKKIKQHCGDIGFTHKGLSGPGILDFSRFFEEGDVLKINILNKNQDELREDFIEKMKIEGKTSIKKYLKQFEIPESLIKILLTEAELEPEAKLATINSKTRNRLIELFCEYPIPIDRIGGFNMAMATCGGVSINEVSQKTMASKRISNLYFAGEVLDVDGDTGGYNIQAAFSTAYLAAKNIS
ncbi:MAG: NAD(P)/FAD-dependent oxidoreductase [Bacteroidales bacterium]|nr:NAD(P)/FAD-dependent oxidoreductase [Bacteroidales bacterium]